MTNQESKALIENYLLEHNMQNVFSKEVLSAMTLTTLPKGEALTTLNEPLVSFHLLVEGKVKIYTLQENGKKVLIRFYKPMSVIGDLEFLSDYPARCIVEALEPTLLITVPMDLLRASAMDCPVFLRFIVQTLGHKLYTWSNMAGLNLVYPLENRVASYLISISEISDKQRLAEIQVNSLEEMAEMLCSSYRHLHRILESFEAQGIISRNRSKIRILDYPTLKSLSVGIFE